MFVLHGFLGPDREVCLWAEDADRPVTSSSQALRTARPHPYAVPADQLDQLLPGVLAGKAGERVLRLPSLLKAPLDSPEMIRIQPRPAARTEPRLLEWTIPILRSAADSAADLIAMLADRSSDVRLGASLTFLAELAVYAEELVERGRVLPTIHPGHHHPGTDAEAAAVASWRPVLQGPDIMATHAFVTAMPPVCRAFVGSGDDPLGGHAGGVDAHALTMAALTAFVDTAARRTLRRPQRSPSSGLLPPRRGRRPRRLPATEAWLEALTGVDGRFWAEPDEVAALATTLRPLDEIGVGSTGPGRAVFRLSDGVDSDEPGIDESETEPPAAWRLEFLLQSTADPSLLVPAEQAWADDGALARWLERPQELLLAELGRACRIYPALTDGLRQATPSELELSVDGAFDFLQNAAPRLDEAGFGVLLPSWWDKRAKLGLKLSAKTPADQPVTGGMFSMDKLARFSWELAVGGVALTDAEITALSEVKAPLIRLRGRWVAVDTDQLERGLKFLRRKHRKTMTVEEVIRLAATHPDDHDTPLPVEQVDADGWLGDLLSGAAAASLEPVPTPADFEAELRPYQERGLSWLAFLGSLGLGSCLADDMGLGKTVQLLALESAERTADPGIGPTLLLCPMSLVGNWQREAARFAPKLGVYAHHGRERPIGEELRAQVADTDLVVTTYATGVRDIEQLAGITWHRVVLDEAQAIKNSLSQAAKAARRLRADHRVALTGTPVENRLSELWSIMEFLNPGMLGSYELFRTRYAIPVERHGLTEPADRLRRITRPYLLRRLKTDPSIIDDLPEKLELKQYYRLTVEQASLYQSVVDDMLEKIQNSKGIERRGNVLAAMAKLKQVCNHPAQLLHDRSEIGRRSGKVIRLEEILEEILAEGDRVLAFTQFTEFAELLLPHLAARFGRDVLYLHGGTPKDRRDELVARFQAGDGPPIFLLSLKAGGTGLNLTAANQVIHLDRWWNPAVENQATDRAFRIGQQRNVTVHKFICTGTLEERIDEMIEQKKALADLVITDGEGWLTELSTRELRDLFTLSEGAVDE